MQMRQRPVLYDGRVTGQGTATIEFDYEVMLDECSSMDFYGEADWTEDDMIQFIGEQLMSAISDVIEYKLDQIGYREEPSITSASNVELSSADIDYLEIEFEDVEDDDE